MIILLIVVAFVAFILGANPALRVKVVELLRKGWEALVGLVKKLIEKIKG